MAKQDIIQHFRTLTPGRAPLSIELEQGEFFFNVADGHVYWKDANENIKKLGEVREQVFNVSSNGTKIFPIPADSTVILSIYINQLEYSEFASINPAGSGIVVYDDVSGGYSTEIGDFVKIVFF